MSNERNSLTSRYEITVDGLTNYQYQSICSCWVILCRSQFNNSGFQNCVFTIMSLLNNANISLSEKDLFYLEMRQLETE